jgi:hypothetical protein
VRENKKLNLINVYSKIMQDGGNKVGAHIIRNTFAMKAFATTSIIRSPKTLFAFIINVRLKYLRLKLNKFKWELQQTQITYCIFDLKLSTFSIHNFKSQIK